MRSLRFEPVYADETTDDWPIKYISPELLLTQIAALPRPLVFTNGVFDLLHRGHVQYLQQARQLGASLLVAVNSDQSVKTLHKGPERPLQSAADRVWVLSALECVTCVTLFNESTPLQLLAVIRPDVYVKGGDYDMVSLPESALMATWGGRSLTLPYRQGYSTTGLIQRIRQTVEPRHTA